MDKTLLTFFTFFTFFSLFGQIKITGVVKDATTLHPLEGAVILSQRDTSISKTNGTFEIDLPHLPAAIVISHLGFESYATKVETQQALHISLKTSHLALNEVVITNVASPLKVRNTTSSISIINSELFERDDPLFISKSLNRVPGVYMQAGTYNTSRLTLRGIGSRSLYGTNKIKAYFDNIPLTDGSGNSSIEDIDQALIDQIMITKGPNSSIYGAGLGGTISFTSAEPTIQRTDFKTGLTVGSFDTQREFVQVNHHDDKVALRAVVSNIHSTGYRENSTYNRQQAGITSTYSLPHEAKLSLLAVYTHLKAYIPSSIDAETYDQSPQKAAFTWAQSKGFESYDHTILGLSYYRPLNTIWSIKTSVFTKYKEAYEARPFNILKESTLALGTRNSTIAVWSKTELVIGFELFLDRYKWQTYTNDYDATTNGSVEGAMLSNNLEHRHYLNAFAQSTYHWTTDLDLTAGLNVNTTSYLLKDRFRIGANDQSGSYHFSPVLSPKIGLVYEAVPSQTIFFNVSHGFSPPSLEETLYPDGQINQNISPEQGWNYEVGIRGKAQHLHYDLTTYYMHIKDLLVAQRISEDTYIGVNAGLNKHFGIDLMANYFLEFDDHTLNIYSSVAFMDYHFSDFTNEGISYDGNKLTGVPKWTFNPGIDLFGKKGMYGNLNGQYVSAIPMNDANSLYSKDYFILRTKIGYKKSFGRASLDLSFGVDNLSDEKYASMLLINATGFNGSAPRYYYPAMPRNYYSTLMFKYLFND